jgi:hypothetical protein
MEETTYGRKEQIEFAGLFLASLVGIFVGLLEAFVGFSLLVIVLNGKSAMEKIS